MSTSIISRPQRISANTRSKVSDNKKLPSNLSLLTQLQQGLIDELLASKQELTELKTKYSKLNRDYRNNTALQLNYASDRLFLNKQIDQLKAHVLGLEAALTSSQENLEFCQCMNDFIQSSYDNLERERDSLRLQSFMSEAELSRKNEIIIALNRQVFERNCQLESSNDSITQLKSHEEELMKQIQELNEQNAELLKRNTELILENSVLKSNTDIRNIRVNVTYTK